MGMLNVIDVNPAGAVIVFAPADVAGDEFVNDGDTTIHVKTGATPTTVTIKAQRKCDQGYLHDVSMDVLANSEKAFGPFPPNRFNKADALTEIEYTDATDVLVAATSN